MRDEISETLRRDAPARIHAAHDDIVRAQDSIRSALLHLGMAGRPALAKEAERLMAESERIRSLISEASQP